MILFDSRPLHGRGHGESGEKLPQGTSMRTLGGNLREKQKIRENKRKTRGKKNETEPLARNTLETHAGKNTVDNIPNEHRPITQHSAFLFQN